MIDNKLNKILLFVLLSLFIGISSITSAINVSVDKNYFIERNSAIEDTSSIIIVDNEGDGDFTDINNAIKAAKSGDTIEVYSGVYYENVIVEKQLTLKGIAKELGTGDDMGKPVIDSEGFGNLENSNSSIKLKANNCIVENFTLINSGGFFGAGVKIYSNYNIIRNNLISNNWYGVNPLEESSFNFIYNNDIKDNDCFGVKCGSLIDDLCSNNNISNNTISGNTAGIAVAPKDIVYKNTIFNNKNGIILESENSQVIKNTIYENEIGVFAHEKNLAIKHNNINNNAIGIEIFYCEGIITICNNLTENDIGIWIQDSKSSLINYNNFFNNTIQAKFIYSPKPRNTNWDRNYWSDWKTTNPRPIEGKIVIHRWPDITEEYPYTQYDKFPSEDPIHGTKLKIKIKIVFFS